jgi:sugar phosphate isomerase/epimerase
VLWAGTLGFERPVFERLDAARSIDVQRFSVTPLDIEWAASEGINASELGQRIRGVGCDVVMDPVVNWYGGTPHPGSRFGRFTTGDTLRMSADLGVVSMNLIGQPTHDASLDQLATSFAAVCDRAADIGAQAHLEFAPITAIDDLAAGWSVVRAADHPSGGLMFDTWHFFRSTPDLTLLEQIPGERIFSVQVADAAAVAGPDVRHDTQHRLLPGDGALDLVTVLRTLHRIGGLGWVGPEVISPDLAAMPAAIAAQVADSRVRELVATAASP